MHLGQCQAGTWIMSSEDPDWWGPCTKGAVAYLALEHPELGIEQRVLLCRWHFDDVRRHLTGEIII